MVHDSSGSGSGSDSDNSAAEQGDRKKAKKKQKKPKKKRSRQKQKKDKKKKQNESKKRARSGDNGDEKSSSKRKRARLEKLDKAREERRARKRRKEAEREEQEARAQSEHDRVKIAQLEQRLGVARRRGQTTRFRQKRYADPSQAPSEALWSLDLVRGGVGIARAEQYDTHNSHTLSKPSHSDRLVTTTTWCLRLCIGLTCPYSGATAVTLSCWAIKSYGSGTRWSC